MYWGGFEHSVDEKGRVIIPSKFRYQLGQVFIITKGLDHCLFVLDAEYFRTAFLDKVRQLAFLDKNSIMLQRFFCAEAVDASVDNQGRVAIPANLRNWANIDLQSEVMINGMTNHVEIWSKPLWRSYMDNMEEDALIAAAEAAGVGRGLLTAAEVLPPHDAHVASSPSQA